MLSWATPRRAEHQVNESTERREVMLLMDESSTELDSAEDFNTTSS
jgi:hypothetical protein